MKCPQCDQPMTEFRTDTTQSKKTGQQYTRTFYECQKDDTWVTQEIPITQDEKQREATSSPC